MKRFVNKLVKLRILILQILLIIVMFDSHLFAQTQGQEEEKWAKDIFKKRAQIQNYPKFSGKIIKLDNNSFKFDEKTLIVDNPSEGLKALLQNGIFYPNIIVGNSVAIIKTKQELDSLTDTQRVFYNMTRTDSITISDFEELRSLSKPPKQKRFKFYLYSIGMMNPTVFYIELTNEKATRNCSLIEFMNGSRVTYIEKGSLLL
jgi:hypothetical protein